MPFCHENREEGRSREKGDAESDDALKATTVARKRREGRTMSV